ncbi:hypothetical protein KJ590_01555 [Patescibacteria group bacterium]|nr:hypothetical protein [Patescibacteria group bacterium]
MLLPILSALLGIIAFSPLNFYPLAFFGLVPLFIFFAREQKLWRLVLGTALFRLIFGLGTVYYTLEPIFWTSSLLIFLGLPITIWGVKKIINYCKIKNPLPPSFVKEGWGGFLPLLAKERVGVRWISKFKIYLSLFSNYLPFALLPFLWSFFDLLEARWSLMPAYIFTAGNALGSSPFLGLANFGGIATLTFFVVAVNTLITTIVLSVIPAKAGIQKFWIPGQARNDNKKCVLYQILALVLLLLSAWQISQSSLRQNDFAYAALPHSFKFAAVSVSAKFDLSQFGALKNELAGQNLDLIVWPEDIIGAPRQGGTPDTQTFFLAQNTAKELKVNLLAAFDTTRGNARYNSAVLFNQQGGVAGQYDKNRLTFIGEFWPFGHWLPPLADWVKKFDPSIANYAMFDPANAYRRGARKLLTLDLPQGPALFAAPICLEVHYPGDLADYQKAGARFIVNPSSNRWINAGAKHLLYLTDNLKKVEAVWLNLPIISSGVKDYVGLTLPNGQARLVDYQNPDKNYAIFFGEIKY